MPMYMIDYMGHGRPLKVLTLPLTVIRSHCRLQAEEWNHLIYIL